MNNNTDTFTALLEQPYTPTSPATVEEAFATRDTSAADGTLAEFIEQIDSEQKTDYLVDRDELSITLNTEGNLRLDYSGLEIPFSEFFISQLDEGIAPGFKSVGRTLRGLGVEGREEYARAANWWLSRGDRRHLLRTVANGTPQHARSIHSDQYKRIDDDLVFGHILPVLAESKDQIVVEGGNRTDLRTYLRVRSRKADIEIDIGRGRIRRFHLGIQISNSEVGRGYTLFTIFIYDSYCKNGCVIGKKVVADVKHLHRGARLLGSGPINDALDRVEQAEIAGGLRDATRAALDPANYSGLVDVLGAAAEAKVPEGKSLTSVLKSANKHAGLGLSPGQIENVLEALEPGDRTRLGLVSAVTAHAQTVGTYEARQGLEQAGGKLLTVDDRAWSRSLQDAVEGLS